MFLTVAVLDDHPLVLQGIESMLKTSRNLEIRTYTLAQDFLDEMPFNEPDILLLDIQLKDTHGVDFCAIINEKFPNIKVIGLSSHDNPDFIKKMLENGAKSYLLKNTEREELLEAIRCVHKGEIFLPDHIKDIIESANVSHENNPDIPKLSRREKQVLYLISQEKTTSDIAEELEISPKTVESHRKNLMQKFNSKNTAGLMTKASKLGLT